LNSDNVDNSAGATHDLCNNEVSRPPFRRRLIAAIFGFKPLTLLFMWIATRVDRPLMLWSDGRIRLSFVIPVLLLKCTGAKSGRPRVVPLLYAPDGDEQAGADIVVIASHGGQPRNPAWYFNLLKTPRVQCTLKGFTATYKAHLLSGVERKKAWVLANSVYPGYDRYQQCAGDRLIPVFRLERAG